MAKLETLHKRRQRRNRYNLKKRMGDRVRLSVSRSNKQIYAQIIDDSTGKTLASASSADKDLKLNIVGRGDDEQRLREIAKSLNLKNINFLGFVSEREKIKHLQNAWFMVNPSFVEGWSITNIEANACRTPVIGSNVHGIKDSILDNKTGFLFPYGDENRLAEKIKTLLNNKYQRKKMEIESLKWARNFSWEKSADAFLDLMNKTLKNE